MTITDWIEIAITFNTKCNECGKDVLPGKAFWSTSAKAPGICLVVRRISM